MGYVLGRHYRWLDITAVILGLVALVMHVLGTAYPVWWVLHEHDKIGREVTLYYGIWVIRVCELGSCETQSSRMHDDRAWLIGPATLLIMAAVMLLAVVALHIVIILDKHNRAILQKLCVVLSSGAGAVIVLAVLIFYKKKAGLRPSTAPETTSGDPGWALFVSTFGGLVGIGNAILIGYNVRRNFHRSQVNFLFGIIPKVEMEIDVNALRNGDLVQGEGVNEGVTVNTSPDGQESNDKRLYKKQSNVRSTTSLYSISGNMKAR